MYNNKNLYYNYILFYKYSFYKEIIIKNISYLAVITKLEN